MTKRDFETYFRSEVMPFVRAQESAWGNGVDNCLRREAWNNETDAWCKMGRISSHQYETWVHPNWLEGCR